MLFPECLVSEIISSYFLLQRVIGFLFSISQKLDNYANKFFSTVCLSGAFLCAASFAFPIAFFWGTIVVFGKQHNLFMQIYWRMKQIIVTFS